MKNCRFEDVGFGVWTEFAGSSDFYIADNLFIGRLDRYRLIGWTGPLWASAGPYASHEITSYYAVKVYGPGHVIARNAIAYFHDGIGISTYGTPEQDPDRRASSIDIYGNDIHMSDDDFVETDGGVHNIRVFNNRGVNAAHGGYSAQPVFGGPVYFIGNIAYHVPSGVAFKFSAKPAGLFVYHNTIIGEQTARDPSSNVHFRNNLFLGRDTPERGIMTWANATSAYSSDYNGYRPNKGVAAQYAWLAPATGKSAYEPAPDDWKNFRTLSELRAATGNEAHGVELDFDIFERMTPPDPSKRHAVVPRDGSELRAEAEQQSRGCRRDYPDGQRRVRGTRTRSRSDRIRQTRAQVRTALARLATVLPLKNSSASLRLCVGALRLSLKKRQETLAAADEVGQLPEHVGVDLRGIGQNARAGLVQIAPDKLAVVHEAECVEVADPIRQLEKLRPAAALLHDAQQEIGLLFLDAIHHADGDLQHQRHNGWTVGVEPRDGLFRHARQCRGILEEVVNHRRLEQHGIHELVVEQDGQRAELMAEHVAAATPLDADERHRLDDVWRERQLAERPFDIVHDVVTIRSGASRRDR